VTVTWQCSDDAMRSVLYPDTIRHVSRDVNPACSRFITGTILIPLPIIGIAGITIVIAFGFCHSHGRIIVRNRKDESQHDAFKERASETWILSGKMRIDDRYSFRFSIRLSFSLSLSLSLSLFLSLSQCTCYVMYDYIYITCNKSIDDDSGVT